MRWVGWLAVAWVIWRAIHTAIGYGEQERARRVQLCAAGVKACRAGCGAFKSYEWVGHLLRRRRR